MTSHDLEQAKRIEISFPYGLYKVLAYLQNKTRAGISEQETSKLENSLENVLKQQLVSSY